MYIRIGKLTLSIGRKEQPVATEIPPAVDPQPPERRSTTIENPGVPLTAANIAAVFATPESRSGVSVDEDTAMTFSAVFSCVDIISATLASLPLGVFRREGEIKSADPSHALYNILHNEPCESYSSFDWRQLMQMSVLLWGNGYSKIIRNRRTYAVEWLDFIHPSLVEPYQVIRADGTKTIHYRIYPTGEVIYAENMLHVKGISKDGIRGMSPVEVAADAIGLGLAAERFGSEFFANGASFTGTLSTDQPLKTGQVTEVAKNWKEAHIGQGRRAGTAILPFGFHFTPIGIPPEQAQYLGTRKFQLEEIARMYHVPLHMLANLDRSTNNNIEHQGIEFVTNTMRPWCIRWEQEQNRKLIREDEKASVFTEFNLDALLRGDSVSRGQFYDLMVRNRIYTRNEVRALENKNPIEGLDELPVINEPAKVSNN